MKIKFLHSTLFFSLLLSTTVFAQLTNGSTTPDWKKTDIEVLITTFMIFSMMEKWSFSIFRQIGVTQCWNYHNTWALENLYNQYGPNGTDVVMVIMIEGDVSTNTACLYFISGVMDKMEKIRFN